ncbi:group III truncated hemoglobin [Methylobrevis pamukkalensis]|uniref:Group 3 truncated hemoglobin ctb n=1 Tax=Methylobrevis pamukkalensis TaxID=1439726 RepID=A0A1E3H6K7_9HYPH|nr:group III truncated hemoglobin [Methylobrevis pamukkalensis]ODN71952.1 Group 3 truncated hemoglobin ctb [Methylobrevis pamukkalensis]
MAAETAATGRAASGPFAVHPAITAEGIDRLVAAFYAKARADDLLGPVFASKVEDWPAHEAKIRAFWSAVMLRSGGYDGRPLPAHLPLPIDERHFARWLALFGETAREVLAPEAAAIFEARARLIGASFLAAIIPVVPR